VRVKEHAWSGLLLAAGGGQRHGSEVVARGDATPASYGGTARRP
jgi:hypothetical protein